MDFLAKLNPKATWRTVLRRSIISCIAAAGLWELAMFFRFNPEFQPTWWVFALFMVCAAIVGAVWEWQVAPESNDDPRDKVA